MDRFAEAGIRRAVEADIPEMAQLNSSGFQGNRGDLGAALEWVRDHFHSGKRYHYFIIEREGKVVGYIGWEIRGGYVRSDPAVELEQLSVDPRLKGQGLARLLIATTMPEMKRWVQKNNNYIASNIRFFVWGYFDNEPAHSVYREFFPQCRGYREQFGPRAEIMRYIDLAWAHSANEGVD
ncbi:MAG TPA: GNAT family N-acetyltransferase [Candidatus Paceibacterota bacterium]|nr:GNAT family N-acetyltransferase [Candidatus Paceibacterota bacterium]